MPRWRSSSRETLWLEAVSVEPGDWIDRPVDITWCDACRVDLEVDVRSEGSAGHPYSAYKLARRYSLADADRDSRHVRHQCVGAVGVLDGDIVAGPAAGRSDSSVSHHTRSRSV